MSLVANKLNSEVRELHWLRLVHNVIFHWHGFLASTRRRRQQKSMMAPALGQMGADGHAGAGSHATGSILGQMPQAPFLGPHGHAGTRPQSEDSTQMPQAKFLGPQEPEIRLCEACPDQDTLEDKGDSPRMCTVSPVCDTVDARDMARFSDVQRLW